MIQTIATCIAVYAGLGAALVIFMIACFTHHNPGETPVPTWGAAGRMARDALLWPRVLFVIVKETIRLTRRGRVGPPRQSSPQPRVHR